MMRVDMLEVLYSLQQLTINRTARSLSVDVRSVEHFFRSLRKLGVYVKPDIDHRALGVCRCVVILLNTSLDIERIRGAPFIRRKHNS